MKINFYHYEDKEITINTDVILEDGELLFDGFDYGKRVKELRGISSEYEYKLSLDQKSTTKLFEVLGVADKTDEQKLSALKEKFGEHGRTSDIQDFCDGHGIKTKFFCWP